MERLTFGHGFVPRIGWANHRAIDRALSSPSLIGDEPSEILWVIVDGAWATPDTPLLTHLRNLGVRILIDSQTWRFADERTWDLVDIPPNDHYKTGPLGEIVDPGVHPIAASPYSAPDLRVIDPSDSFSARTDLTLDGFGPITLGMTTEEAARRPGSPW